MSYFGAPGSDVRCQLHDRLRCDDRRVCVCRGGSRGHAGCAGLRARGRQSGTTCRMDVVCGNRIEVQGNDGAGICRVCQKRYRKIGKEVRAESSVMEAHQSV